MSACGTPSVAASADSGGGTMLAAPVLPAAVALLAASVVAAAALALARRSSAHSGIGLPVGMHAVLRSSSSWAASAPTRACAAAQREPNAQGASERGAADGAAGEPPTG